MSDRDDKIQALVMEALNSYDNGSARSQQSRNGILGPSDIGFCRQKAALVTKQTPPSDESTKWAAMVGTALHTYIEAAIKQKYPDWLCGSIDKIRTTATLPSGAVISGSPDIIVPSANAILDIKTVDGFEWVKREGTSQNHKYQRHLYALGALETGLLAAERPVVYGNVYFDRSGKVADCFVLTDEFDETLTDEIDSWVQDVIYAVAHNEDASRDLPAAVCERICEFFTVCRGGLEVHEGGDLITDRTLLSAIDMYVEARDLEKAAAAQKKEAQSMLYGVNGTTGEYQVRWVQVAPTTVQAFEKQGYDRMDIRKVRK